MNGEIQSKKLFNLVLFELENYIKNITNNPNNSYEANVAELRTAKAPLYRAIHWYLHDNYLICQNRALKIKNNSRYDRAWVLKDFDKLSVCEKITEKYASYLTVSINNIEEMIENADFGLEQELRLIKKQEENIKLNNYFFQR
jgi:uncharacterized protein YdcH (DUF465 family)